VIKNLYSVLKSHDATMMEINPLVKPNSNALKFIACAGFGEAAERAVEEAVKAAESATAAA
jgi:succinyl-CoA synthetase beta subunit